MVVLQVQQCLREVELHERVVGGMDHRWARSQRVGAGDLLRQQEVVLLRNGDEQGCMAGSKVEPDVSSAWHNFEAHDVC